MNNVATASAMSLYLYLLILLHHVPGLPGEPVHQGIECSQDSPGTLCLTKDYSTFDLPYKTKPNLIKIGKIHIMQENVLNVFVYNEN